MSLERGSKEQEWEAGHSGLGSHRGEDKEECEDNGGPHHGGTGEQ